MGQKARKDKEMLTVRFNSRRSVVEFKVAAKQQGGSASEAVRRFAFELIHKMRERDPEAFDAAVQEQLEPSPKPSGRFAPSRSRGISLKRVK